MRTNNQNGAALVIVLIFLITAAVLVASLFIVAKNHINSAVREEGISKAFYNADAGVEFIKANAAEINLSSINDGDSLEYENENVDFNQDETYVTASDLNINDSQLEFSVKAEKNNNIVKFTSTGIYRVNNKEFKKNITFNLSKGLGSVNKIFNILEKPGEEIIMKSKASELNEDMALKSADISPTLEKWQEVMNGADNWSDVITNSPGSGNGQGNGNNSTIYNGIFVKSSGDETLQGNTFKNSILLINGDLTLKPQNSFENTIVIIDGDFKVKGAPNFDVDNTLFFIYNAQEVQIAGNPKNINPAVDYSKLPIDLTAEGTNLFETKITNWNEN